MKSYKHKDKRLHIPSKEEAGYEEASNVVMEKEEAYLPLNPVTTRGQDPELWWMNKYGNDNRDELLKLDIRSLYRHEHISPEIIMQQLYRLQEQKSIQLSLNDLFGNALGVEEEDKVSEYYKHLDGWSNRLIQGDSLLVMASLLEREGMAGKVQTIYFDPPYGIKYGSNWQIKLNNRDVKDGNDDALTGEGEQIKAFRDTWELGIHSYLSYLRDRLLVAKELLTESGSCFVQISDENVHLVRNLMDEVFGSENFVNIINYRKTSAQTSDKNLAAVSDYIIWYGKNKDTLKFRQIFVEKEFEGDVNYKFIEKSDGSRLSFSNKVASQKAISGEGKLFRLSEITSQTGSDNSRFEYSYAGKKFRPSGSRGWSTSKEGLDRLAKLNRLEAPAGILCYVRYFEDFPVRPVTNYWEDTGSGGFADDKLYVVQSGTKAIQRCVLMTSDPGDLILDPTCGSGTTAYIAEQWGRRWITIDTSRIALNIAKTRLMTANFPFYKLYDERLSDLRQGFFYKTVPHVTLKSLANDEPPATETLYDQPEVDNKKMRVAGPFTVETLQAYDPVSPDEMDAAHNTDEGFEQRILDHLKSAGIKNGIKNENAVFTRIDPLHSEYLHYQGFYNSKEGERMAYIHVGPKFGSVSKQAVSQAIKECRTRGHADWLIILGFSFESDIQNESVTSSMGNFELTKVRMHDDLMQAGLLKKDKKAASFVTIGEPDIALHKKGKEATVEIRGLDIYDPIRDEVKPRDLYDIAYWMVDDDYDGSNFIVKQVFFCGGDKDEFAKWKKDLTKLSESRNKRREQLQNTLKIEIDEEAFDRLYGHESHPIEYKKGKRIAVRVISQFGEESTKVLTME